MNFNKKPKEFKDLLKSWWHKLTGEDLQKIEKNGEQLISILQKRYGWSKRQTKQEINRQLEQYHRQIVSEDKIPDLDSSLEEEFSFDSQDMGAELDYESANESILAENDFDDEADWNDSEVFENRWASPTLGGDGFQNPIRGISQGERYRFGKNRKNQSWGRPGRNYNWFNDEDIE
jgi:uncharacterized protein YjbJ (UPF0337 family)